MGVAYRASDQTTLNLIDEADRLQIKHSLEQKSLRGPVYALAWVDNPEAMMIIAGSKKFIAATFASEEELELIVQANSEYIFGPDSSICQSR